MKIKNDKDVALLDQEIKTELGIDVGKYKNEEVAEEFVALLLFPKYFANWVMRPVIVSVLLYVSGFFLMDLPHIQFYFYGFVGFFLFLICGFLAGLLLLSRRIKKDTLGIAEYSLGVMKSSIVDIGQVGSRMDESNKKDVLGLLFQGIIHIVTIPMLSNAIEEKVPFVGGFTKNFMKRTLIAISDRINFDVNKIDENIDASADPSSTADKYLVAITKANANLHKVIFRTTRFIQIPLKILFYIFFFILLLFLYFIW